jgi:hypothetical protein
MTKKHPARITRREKLAEQSSASASKSYFAIAVSKGMNHV